MSDHEQRRRYRFLHRGGDRYYWQTGVIPGDSRVEQVSCSVDWFWARPTITPPTLGTS